jgi:hypothetical protein
MDDQFQHPRATALLGEVRNAFEKKPIFQRREKPVIFLCGGPLKSRKKTMRRDFLRWSNTNFPEIVTLLAEDAYKHTNIYDQPETVNLSEFEKIISTISDCVLLFPESEGSFAELGLFSGFAEVRKKILVANAIGYQAQDSFINLGPIKTIDHNSYLSPTIQIAKRNGQFDFEPLRVRLERLTHRTYRKSFRYASYRDLDYLGKFLVTLEIISICHYVSFESLSYCIRFAFGTTNQKHLRRTLSILAGAGYIKRHDQFFSLIRGKRSLLEFEDIRIDDIKARILEYYERHRPDLFKGYQRLRRSPRWR